MNTSKITKEQLLEFGMIEVEPELGVSMEKLLGKSEAGVLSLTITHYRNLPELTLMLPDGAMVYLACETIDDLKTVERCISSYEPNY